MKPEESFADLIARVRAGDADAAAELVRQFEPEIRRAIRVRLTDARLHRLVDSVDICQSVLCNFFVRAAAGQFELDRPEQVLKLLVRMAKNKFLDYHRRQRADRRDQRRQVAADSGLADLLADDTPGASRVAAGRELWERVQAHLSEEERYLAEQRGQGRDWNDLAAELNAKPDALRKKLTRALDRIAADLGLDEFEGR